MSIKRLENEIAKLKTRLVEKDIIIADLTSRLAAMSETVPQPESKPAKRPTQTSFADIK